jgi:hypothetical protein
MYCLAIISAIAFSQRPVTRGVFFLALFPETIQGEKKK